MILELTIVQKLKIQLIYHDYFKKMKNVKKI